MGRHQVLAIVLALSLAAGSGMAPAQRVSISATVSATVIAVAETVVVVPVAPPDSASGVAMFVSGLTGDLRIRLPAAAAASGLDEVSVRAALAALHAERKGACIHRNGRQAMQLGRTEKGLLEGNPVSCLGLDIPAPDAAHFDSVSLIMTYN